MVPSSADYQLLTELTIQHIPIYLPHGMPFYNRLALLKQNTKASKGSNNPMEAKILAPSDKSF